VSGIDRVVLVARLKAGECERAEKLLADGVEPIVPEAVDRWVVFLPSKSGSQGARQESAGYTCRSRSFVTVSSRPATRR